MAGAVPPTAASWAGEGLWTAERVILTNLPALLALAGSAGPGDRHLDAGADTGQGGDRGIAFDCLQVRAGRAARGEEQGVVGEVLQDRGLDGVFVDPLGGGGVAPAGAVGP